LSIFRRQRQWNDLVNDSQTPYMIGRLLGANEMAIALLAREDNDTSKKVAEVLDRLQDYFIEPGQKGRVLVTPDSDTVVSEGKRKGGR
jgi:hypothetical protein